MPGEKDRPAAYWRRMCALESACENTRAEDVRDVPGIAIANGMRDAHSTNEHVLPGDLAKVQAIVEKLLTIDMEG